MSTVSTVRRRPHVRVSASVSHILVWSYAALLILPLYYLLVTSFKSNIEIFDQPFALPHDWIFSNFIDAFSQAGLGKALMNSLIITAGAELVTLVLAIPAAFALARSKGRLGVAVERIFALGFLIPGFAALVPTVLMSIALGLWQTRIFLIMFMPATAMPLSVILLTQFMRTVPPELEEAAALDGASQFTVLRRIYLPLAVPGIVTVVILNFLHFWNEFLFALVILGYDADLRTAQVALPTLVSEGSTQYGVLAAGVVITLVPIYVMYIVLQRRMEEALTEGAVK